MLATQIYNKAYVDLIQDARRSPLINALFRSVVVNFRWPFFSVLTIDQPIGEQRFAETAIEELHHTGRQVKAVGTGLASSLSGASS
jgi:hypothetical protein